MTAHTPPLHIPGEARTTSRTRRGVALCACGAEFPDTADGRRNHQTIYSHRVTPVTEATP